MENSSLSGWSLKQSQLVLIPVLTLEYLPTFPAISAPFARKGHWIGFSAFRNQAQNKAILRSANPECPPEEGS
jgi:hypothetical protein